MSDPYSTLGTPVEVDPFAALGTPVEGAIGEKRDTGPVVSQGRAAVLGGLAGASANLADEVYGLSKASGLPDWLGGFRAPVGAARMLYGKYAGEDPEFIKQYETATAERRAEMKAAQAQHPGTYLTGEVAGSLAVPGGAAVRGATLPIRAARGAAFGGAYGAAAGAGGGETPEERVKGGVAGGAMGTILGGVAPVAIETALQGGRAVLAPIAGAVRGGVNPQGEAARLTGQAIESGIAADPAATARLTTPEFAANVAQGGPAMLLDIGGESARDLARAASNASPEARQVLNAAIDPRFETQSERVAEHLRSTTPFPNTAARERAMEQTARGTNAVGYGAAYAAGAGNVGSPELERLASSDAVASAMRSAAAKAGDEAVVSGYGAMNPRVTFTPDGRVQFQKSPSGMPVYPDLQFWDLTRRQLGDAAIAAGRGTDEARRLGGLARRLNSALDAVVPEYEKARQGAAHFFGAENALEAGENFVGQGKQLGIDRAQIAFQQMTPEEQQVFRHTYAAKEANRILAIPDRADVTKRIANSPAARAELELGVGPQHAADIGQTLRQESMMDLARQAVQGNSTTARQLAQMYGGSALGFGGAGGLGAIGAYNQDPTKMGIAAGMAGLTAGGRRINQNVMRGVADILSSNDPTRLVRDQIAHQLAGQSPAVTQTLTDRAIAGIQDRARASANRSAIARQLLDRSLGGGAVTTVPPALQ